MKKLVRNPAMITGAVMSALALAQEFGLPLTPSQVSALLVFLGTLGALFGWVSPGPAPAAPKAAP